MIKVNTRTITTVKISPTPITITRTNMTGKTITAIITITIEVTTITTIITITIIIKGRITETTEAIRREITRDEKSECKMLLRIIKFV
jgi:hypothetical protein